MAKGEIVGHDGEALYKVRLKYASDRAQAQLGRVNDRIAELAVDLPNKKVEVAQAEDEVEQTARDIDLLIPDYRANPDENTEAIKKLQTELIRKSSVLAQLRYQRDLLIAENLSLLKRRGQIEAIPEDKLIRAWCVDLTENLTGTVGLIDINDEGGQGYNIQPGYVDGATYDSARDGQLVPREAQSGAQVWFNAAILPGVQKWQPRYRVGTISDIQNDVCKVTLDTAKSTAQQLDINQSEALSDVPIVYMDCNGNAFEDGDRVLVRFTGSGPLVIGFEKEPRSCFITGIMFQPAMLDLSGGYVVTIPGAEQGDWVGQDLTKYGKPLQDSESNPINYPLGTNNGADPAWLTKTESGGLETTRGQTTNYGLGNWLGRNDDILSWHSDPGRLHDFVDFPSKFKGLRTEHRRDKFIYYRQQPIDLDIGNIIGAAIRKDEDEIEWLYAVNDDHEIYRATISGTRQVTGAAEFVAQYLPSDPDFSNVTGWYFSTSGNKAVCTFKPRDSVDHDGDVKVVRFDATTGAISESLEFDKSEVVGSRVTTKTTTNNHGEYPNALIYSSRIETDVSVGQYTVPLYYDFKGDQEIYVYAEIGASTSSIDDYRIVSLLRNGPPEPSGPQPGVVAGGQTITIDEVQTDGPVKIYTSDGALLSQVGASNYERQEVSTYDDPSRSFSGSVTSSFTSRSLLILSIDARFDACFNKMTVETGTGSGSDPVTFLNGSARVSGPLSTSLQTDLVIYKADTEKTKELLFSSQDSFTGAFPIDRADVYGSQPGNGVTVTTKDIEKQKYLLGDPQLLNFMAYSKGQNEFFSAIYINQLTEFKRLLFKTGPLDIIDAALAVDEKMCLFDAGIA